MALTPFGLPVNNVVAAVDSGGYTSGSGVLNLVAGQGAQFGSLGANQFYRITVIQNSVAYSALATPSNFTIFKATGRSTDQFTGVTAIEGTTDRSYVSADVVDVRVTAGSLTDIQTAVNTLEGQYGNQGLTYGSSVLSGNVSFGSTASGSFIAITSISLSIPAAGTYLITLNVRVQCGMSFTGAGTGNTWITTQLLNQTTATYITVPQTLQLICLNPTGGTAAQVSSSVSWVITFAAAATVVLYGNQQWSGGVLATSYNVIESDVSGTTSMSYLRLA